MKEIYTALVKAQKGFAPALKTTDNPFFKKKYADLSACVEAVMDSLNANGIALIQQCHESETGVVVSTVFVHESGQFLDCGKLHVPAAKNDPQGYGSALTYARRYSLMAACGIAPEDDDGNAASKKPEKQGKLPVLDEKEQEQAYNAWLDEKMTLVNEDGDIPEETLNNAWFKHPSNVRTAINKWKKRLEEQEKEKIAQELDMKQITSGANL